MGVTDRERERERERERKGIQKGGGGGRAHMRRFPTTYIQDGIGK